MKKIFYSLLVAGLPLVVAAQAPNPPSVSYPDTIATRNVQGFSNLFIQYVQYAVNLFWVLAVLFGLFAAFKYLTAKGDPKAAETAKGMVKYTIIAACVALLATVIKEIAKSILGG